MTEKPIIGMFHLLGDTRQGIIDNAIKEMKMKKKYGVAAVLVEESEARVQSIKKRCDEAQREVESSENLIKDLNTQYDEIISWSSLYDSASIEAKKMIVNSMIKRIDVYRNYDLNIELNMNIRQSSSVWRKQRIFRLRHDTR